MQDKVIMNGKWEFNSEVANCFSEMLNRSIPDYSNMRKLVFDIGRKYIKPETTIIDVGCSNGLAIEPFIIQNKENNKYKLFDVSEPMLDLCRNKYKEYRESGIVDVENFDITKGINEKNCSLIMSVLTLQFTPIEYRQKIVDSIYNSLNEGSCFILVEKVLGDYNETNELFVDLYYDMKREHSYTEGQIQNKRKSLEGVLVPITENWNIELLKNAGFKKIDCFWKYLNFCGIIAIK